MEGDSIGIFQALERILQRILVIYSLKRTSDMYFIGYLNFPPKVNELIR